jgi:translation elongation factor EF-Ts
VLLEVNCETDFVAAGGRRGLDLCRLAVLVAPGGTAAARGLVSHHPHTCTACPRSSLFLGDAFTSLAGELAMVVASSDVVCVAVEDMPGDVLAKEREVEMGKEDLKSKPEAVRAKVGVG